jgi:hypothetical protein
MTEDGLKQMVNEPESSASLRALCGEVHENAKLRINGHVAKGPVH